MFRKILKTTIVVGIAAIAATFVIPGMARAADGTAPDEIWQNAEGTVSDILETRSKDKFGEVDLNEAPRGRRLKSMLEKAVDLLSTADVANERDRLIEIQKRVVELRNQIQRAKVDMASAPEGDGGIVERVLAMIPQFGVRTKSAYAAEISRKEGELSELDTEAEGVRATFAEGLRKIGIDLDPKQVDGLMTMATADSLIDMQAAFANMKAINAGLLEATIRSGESLEVAKRYYGLYTIMLEIALYMHDDFVAQVDGEYLTRLEGIRSHTLELQAEARKIAATESDAGLKKVLKSNIDSQNLTLKVAGIYRDRLVEQRDRVKSSARQIERQHRVAVNTWRTVDVSSDLVSMMRTTGKAFDALMKLEIPPIRPFESQEMELEFQKITDTIKTPMS